MPSLLKITAQLDAARYYSFVPKPLNSWFCWAFVIWSDVWSDPAGNLLVKQLEHFLWPTVLCLIFEANRPSSANNVPAKLKQYSLAFFLAAQGLSGAVVLPIYFALTATCFSRPCSICMDQLGQRCRWLSAALQMVARYKWRIQCTCNLAGLSDLDRRHEHGIIDGDTCRHITLAISTPRIIGGSNNGRRHICSRSLEDDALNALMDRHLRLTHRSARSQCQA